jgi:hypothetical protein
MTNDVPGCPTGGLLSGTDGRDNLDGKKGEHEIRGLGGVDVIFGGDGSDVIYGGPGDDTPYGAVGARTSSTGAPAATQICPEARARTSSTGGWQRFLGRNLGPAAG